MYKMNSFSMKMWKKNGVEAIKYNDKKWINEKHLKTALGYKNLVSNKAPYYSNKFFFKEDLKYNIVKIFSLVENLMQKN